MHKGKDGKVTASLTEVKNKTGDIFALVDEFGEITLTSYNKPRYKIIKIGLESTLSLKDKPEKIFKKVKKREVSPIENKNKVSETEVALNIVKEDTIEKEHDQSEIEAWDRNNPKERNFVEKAQKPLI